MFLLRTSKSNFAIDNPPPPQKKGRRVLKNQIHIGKVHSDVFLILDTVWRT